MTFEGAIGALGAELGFDLPIEEGVAWLEASSEGGGEAGISVAISEMPDVGGALLASEVGDVSAVRDLQPLLEANHIFAETAGATLSIEDGRIYFEQYMPLSVIGRGEGERAVKVFVANALEWRRRLAETPPAEPNEEASPDSMQSLRV